MKLKSLSILSAIALSLSLNSCRKKEDPVVPVVNPTGSVKLEFSNKVGTEGLVLNDVWYTNQNGDSFTVSKFNYYISNIKLNNADGGQFIEPESYHLLRHNEPASLEFDIDDVPNGIYKSITFMIGVDSLRNVSGAQTGALTPSDMFWEWSTGYIMLKFEGNSPQSTQSEGRVQLHMGGFSGANSVLRSITLAFPADVVVNANEPHVHLSADVLELFKSPTVINFATFSAVHMPGANAKIIADNYVDMISVTLIGN